MARPRVRRRLTEPQRALAGDPDLRRLATRLARRKARDLPWLRDDLEGAALLGLSQAAGTWRPDGDATFRDFACRRIRGAMRDALRDLRGLRAVGRGGWRAALPKLVPLAEPRALRLPSGELSVGWEAESADSVLGLTRPLPAAERAAIRRLFLGAATPSARLVALAMGVARPVASASIASGLAGLRRRIARATA